MARYVSRKRAQLAGLSPLVVDRVLKDDMKKKVYTKFGYRLRQVISFAIGGWMIVAYLLAFSFEALRFNDTADFFGSIGDWIYDFTDVIKKPEYQKHIKRI